MTLVYLAEYPESTVSGTGVMTLSVKITLMCVCEYMIACCGSVLVHAQL